MNNFRNVPLTLSKKHQFSALESQLSKDYLRDTVEVSKMSLLNITDFPETNFQPYLTMPDQTTLDATDSAIIHGTKYKRGYFVVIENHPRGYLFGKIDSIFFGEFEKPTFLLNLFVTKHFDNFSFCYCIEPKMPAENRCVTLEDLLDFHPLDCFKKTNELFIRLKYKVF